MSHGQAQQQGDDEMRVDPQRASQLVAAMSSIQQAVKGASAATSSSSTGSSSRHHGAGAGAGASTVRLVAVSKLKPASDILALHESPLAVAHFGENYLQELEHKAAVLPRSVRWHFIGGLQTNKCRPLAEGIPNLWAVESVDTVKKADQLEKGRAALYEKQQKQQQDQSGEQQRVDRGNSTSIKQDNNNDRLRIFVQVNTSGEDAKSGVEPGDAAITLCRHIREQCPHLKLQGLMTIGAIARSQSAEPNEDFIALRNVRTSIVEALQLNAEDGELELSMGMSSDFEEAIKQGSSEVRVGSQIFGARPPKPSKDAKAEAEQSQT